MLLSVLPVQNYIFNVGLHCKSQVGEKMSEIVSPTWDQLAVHCTPIWSVNDHLFTSAKLCHLNEVQQQTKSSMWTVFENSMPEQAYRT